MTDIALAWLTVISKATWQGSLAITLVWLIARLCPELSSRTKMWLLRLAYLGCAIDICVTPLPLPLLTPTPLLQSLNIQGGISLILQKYAGAFSLILFCVWAACSAFLAVKLSADIVASVKTSRNWASLSGIHNERYLKWLCRQVCVRLGLTKVPRLATGGNGSPVLVGFVRPVIMVPTEVLDSCSQRELELILAHELAHLRKGDLVWNCLAALVDILFFFNPLFRWASKELMAAQEMDADVVALSVTEADPLEYGRLLARFSLQDHLELGRLFTVGMSSLASLKVRLTQLVHLGSTSKPKLVQSVTAGILGVLIFMMVLPVSFTVKPLMIKLASPISDKRDVLIVRAKPVGAGTGERIVVFRKFNNQVYAGQWVTR